MFSPLEQFEVNSLIALPLFGEDISEKIVFVLFSNMNLFTLIVVSVILLFYRYLSKHTYLVPNITIQAFSEKIIGFIKSLVRENTAAKYRILMVFVPYVLTVFAFILTSNFVGMVPYSFTVTSSLAITLAIASASFIGINIFGARIHGLGFFALFLPPGCPIFISPFIILIETVSYVARVLSLAIRLFANMMAGHTLLKILAGFAWQMLGSGGIWLVIGLAPIAIISAVSVLELAVAFLQTYVFTVLICLYIKDAAELH